MFYLYYDTVSRNDLGQIVATKNANTNIMGVFALD